jgi:hypothetical protein
MTVRTRAPQLDQTPYFCNDQSWFIELNPMPASRCRHVTTVGRAIGQYPMLGNLFRRLISTGDDDHRDLFRQIERSD